MKTTATPDQKELGMVEVDTFKDKLYNYDCGDGDSDGETLEDCFDDCEDDFEKDKANCAGLLLITVAALVACILSGGGAICILPFIAGAKNNNCWENAAEKFEECSKKCREKYIPKP